MKPESPADVVSEILNTLDDALAQSALRGLVAVPNQSVIRELRGRIQRLQNLRAPLYIEEGRGLSRWIKRIVNLPIRALSSKQVIHNRELLDLLTVLVSELEQSQRRTVDAALQIEQQAQQIALLQSSLSALQARIAHWEQSAETKPASTS